MWLLASAASASPVDHAIRRLETWAREEPRPETLAMLGEAWMRAGEERQLHADTAYVEAFDRCFDTPGCDTDVLNPDYSSSNQAYRNASVRYRQVLLRWPEHTLADGAAYGLGFAWRALGEHELADAAFTWLVAARPSSPLAADAWLLIGEHAFERWNSTWSAFAYGRAASLNGPLRPWAQHRLAWSYYRLGDYPRAIETMKEVVSADDGVDLQAEALRDLVRFFADAGQLEEAPAGPSPSRRQMRDMLTHLAEVYEQQGRYDQAIQVWRRLGAQRPEDVVPMEHIVEIYVQQARFEEALAEVDRLERRAPRSHAVEHGLRECGFLFHRYGRAEGRREHLAHALVLYERHLASFPDAFHAKDVAWARAWALRELGREDDAREAFRALADRDPSGKHGPAAAAEASR